MRTQTMLRASSQYTDYGLAFERLLPGVKDRQPYQVLNLSGFGLGLYIVDSVSSCRGFSD